MFYPPSFLDEIREKIRTSDVVRRSVSLKHNGREFSGLCPFHKEKTPSFTVSDEKGFYHCFGCGEHGDIIKFMTTAEGMPFKDAIETLANIAGLAVPEPTRQQAKEHEKKLSLYEIVELAAKFFEDNLQQNYAEEAQHYLDARGVTGEQIAKFRIGFVPNERFSLRDFLKSKKISELDMLATGLVIKGDKGTYDRFRGRIIFPIIDIKNRPIAFGGRIMGDGQPKYLNSPETLLFKKGNVLYNENNARSLAFKTGKVVVSEGYMDVIALDSAGIKVGVAPLGTALTENHIQRLWHMTKEPVLCMDGDKAGQRAMERASNICMPFLKPGYTLKFATMPNGMDPDDVIKASGASRMRDILRNAKSLSDVVWKNELAKKEISTPEMKADLEHRLSEICAKISDSKVANYYRNFFREKMWAVSRTKDSKIKNPSLTDINNSLENVSLLQQYELVALLLIVNFSHILDDSSIYDEFVNFDFCSNKLDNMRSIALEVYDFDGDSSEQGFVNKFLEGGFSAQVKQLNSLKKEIFVQKSGTEEQIKLRWNYNLSLYNVAKIKSESEAIERQMTFESEAKVKEFKGEIARLESQIKVFEQALIDDAS